MSGFYQKLGKNAYDTGINAEAHAARYLTSQHWIIFKKRFRCPFGEIDLIAGRKDWLLFVEVKKRKTMEQALTTLTVQQKNRLIKSAEYYLETHDPNNTHNIQFDLIAINWQNHIEHIKNITAF